MKKIVGGKVYDTATATCLAAEGKSLHSFYSDTESLYKTPGGKYFLHGASSAGGKYGTGDGRTQWGGEDIIPLTPEEVCAWAEQARIDEKGSNNIATELNLPAA